MRGSGGRHGAARLFLKRIGTIGVLALTGAALSGVWGIYKKERESALLRSGAENARADLVMRQTHLADDIAKLKTDRGMEEALREQYALAGSGEELIVIVEPPTSTPVHATSSVGAWFKKTFWWW